MCITIGVRVATITMRISRTTRFFAPYIGALLTSVAASVTNFLYCTKLCRFLYFRLYAIAHLRLCAFADFRLCSAFVSLRCCSLCHPHLSALLFWLFSASHLWFFSVTRLGVASSTLASASPFAFAFAFVTVLHSHVVQDIHTYYFIPFYSIHFIHIIICLTKLTL